MQFGGEVVAEWQGAYTGLVAELGLTLEPSYTALDLPYAWGADEGVAVGERAPWMDDGRPRGPRAAGGASSRRSRATVDPDDPWSHPDAARLDALSVGDWLRSRDARPGSSALLEHQARSLSIDSIERTSLLAQLRKEAAAGGARLLRREPLGDAARGRGLGHAWRCGWRRSWASGVRLGALVAAIDVARRRLHGHALDGGERLGAEAVVCALPVGPLRDVAVSGVSDARLASLHRQRHALAFKTVVAYPTSFWEVGGATSDGVWSSVWIQREGILSSLTPPDRLGPFLASPRRRESFSTWWPRCSATRRATRSSTASGSGGSTPTPRAT